LPALAAALIVQLAGEGQHFCLCPYRRQLQPKYYIDVGQVHLLYTQRREIVLSRIPRGIPSE